MNHFPLSTGACRGCLGLLCLAVCGVLAWGAGHASAAGAEVAADATDFWIASPLPGPGDGVVVNHRHRTDPSGLLRRVQRVGGRLSRPGLAAGGGRLWMVYESGAVRSLRRSGAGGTARFRFRALVERGLPEGTRPERLWANERTLWVLERRAGAGGEVDKGDDGAAGGAARRLLRLGAGLGDGWEAIPLPEGLGGDGGDPVWMGGPVRHGAPHLVSPGRGAEAGELRVYTRRENGRWSTQGLPGPPGKPVDGVKRIEGQWVAWRRVKGEAKVSVFLLRGQGAVELGAIRVPLRAEEATVDLVAHQEMLALVGVPREGEPFWSRVDVRGHIMPAEALAPREPNPFMEAADHLVLVGVLLLATVVMFICWRRDPAGVRIELPASLVPASIGARYGAGVLDLLPPAGASMLVYGIGPEALLEHWPGHSGGWMAAAPGATVIGLFALYTLFFEFFWGRTPGKALLGLRVAGFRGEPARFPQVLVRNLMKVFELVAWLLLLMPLLSPWRQRLGDLVARTLVVTDAPPQREEEF